MARPDKAAAVAELADRFKSSSATVLTEYRGLSVAQLKGAATFAGRRFNLRSRQEHPHQDCRERSRRRGHRRSPGWTKCIGIRGWRHRRRCEESEDVCEGEPALVIKGGYVDGKVISPEEVSSSPNWNLARYCLPKLAGAMNASLSQAVSLFAAPCRRQLAPWTLCAPRSKPRVPWQPPHQPPMRHQQKKPQSRKPQRRPMKHLRLPKLQQKPQRLKQTDES